jgi:hypothetical protein
MLYEVDLYIMVDQMIQQNDVIEMLILPGQNQPEQIVQKREMIENQEIY